ncbi:uncharacterized protein LOC122892332, partial [Neovison vison]|uniref:uncharacterized protein LOC122892332 n=1 Tax=Neovison vison TaxID=452646 RepID=UPI001CEFD0E0
LLRELDQGEAPSPASVCPLSPSPPCHIRTGPSRPPVHRARGPAPGLGPGGSGHRWAPVHTSVLPLPLLQAWPRDQTLLVLLTPPALGWGLPRWPVALPSEAWPARALGAPPSLWQGKRVTLGVRPLLTATGPASLPSTCSLLSASRRGRQAGAEGRRRFWGLRFAGHGPSASSVWQWLCELKAVSPPLGCTEPRRHHSETRICGGVGARLPRLGRNHPLRPDPQTPLMLCPCPDVAAEDPTTQTCPPSGRARQGHPQAGPQPKTTSPAAPCWTLSLKLQPLLLAPSRPAVGGYGPDLMHWVP